MRRGGVASLRGLAHWYRGDLEQAYRWYGEGMASLERAGHRSDVVGGAVTLADIRIAQGRLRDAERLCADGLALATQDGSAVLRGAADMHVGLAALAYERNELATASDHLRQARELGEENGLPKNPWRSRVATARLRFAEGDAQPALELVDDAERRYVGDFSPNVRPVGAVRARMWIAMGRLRDARRWVSTSGLSPADEPTHLREFELATLARLLIAEGRGRRDERALRAAGDLTDRLVQSADAGGRGGSAIDALVAGALARHARGDAAAALATLSPAIERAEPEGHVRVFLDEGPPMASLLAQAAHVSGAASYSADLLAAATATEDRRAGEQSLPEPLSDRELEVLRLLTTELSGPDIAAELIVSLNTLRTHTKNIYAKLDVGSRRAAVRRAAELDLLRGR
jgi:LuxR family maltose regulon positive regulatory protein